MKSYEIVGAGSAGDGNMDAGNILKPALARENSRWSEQPLSMNTVSLRRTSRLERRMQPVKVDEPTVEETITILKGIRRKIRRLPSRQDTDALIEAAAFSNRYIQDRLPDKAIDLLDEAGSKMNLTSTLLTPRSRPTSD